MLVLKTMRRWSLIKKTSPLRGVGAMSPIMCWQDKVGNYYSLLFIAL